MHYLFLAMAVIVEVIATVSLKASEEFTKLVPSVIVIVGFFVTLYFSAIAIRVIPLGIAYSIFSGFCIVFLAIAGHFLYEQRLDIPAIIGMGLIVSGTVVIHIFSETTNR